MEESYDQYIYINDIICIECYNLSAHELLKHCHEFSDHKQIKK